MLKMRLWTAIRDRDIYRTDTYLIDPIFWSDAKLVERAEGDLYFWPNTKLDE